MGLFSSVRNVFSTPNSAPHNYRPSITEFQEQDIDALSRALKLEERGKSRGENEEPPLGSEAYDHIENEIIEKIESDKSRDAQAYADQMEVYAERLASLNFAGRISDLDLSIEASISSFKRLIKDGLDHLHALRRDLVENESSLRRFRERERREDPAVLRNQWTHAIQIMLIAVFGFIESISNAIFLAKGNEQGVLGAYTIAIGISFLNLGTSILFARFSTNLIHMNIFRKFIGLISLILFFIFSFGLNLSVAHFRDATDQLLEGGGLYAIQAMQENPFGLKDFSSWLLMGIGFLFAIFTFIDVFFFEDPYPRYSYVTKTARKSSENYAYASAQLTHRIGEYQVEAFEDLRATKDDLSSWRHHLGVILDHRARWIEAFQSQLDHLNRAGNSLLSIYREANKTARKGKPPARFKESWKMLRPSREDALPPNTMAGKEIDALIATAQMRLDSGMKEVSAIHDRALADFKGLDNLVPDGAFDNKVSSDAKE